MNIEQNRCVQCRKCIPYCPVNAMEIRDGLVVVHQEVCVECGTCLSNGICAYGARVPLTACHRQRERGYFGSILSKMENLAGRFFPRFYDAKEPRYIREIFSNPEVPFRRWYGRGTEEVKTNDATARYGFGEIGFCIEVGRPGVGATVREIQRFTTGLARLGVYFEPQNPTTWLMKDEQGYIKDRYLDERVLSAVIEFRVPEHGMGKILDFIEELDGKSTSVFSVGVISRVKPDGTIPVLEKLESRGFSVSPHAKINLGLAEQPSGGEKS